MREAELRETGESSIPRGIDPVTLLQSLLRLGWVLRWMGPTIYGNR